MTYRMTVTGQHLAGPRTGQAHSIAGIMAAARRALLDLAGPQITNVRIEGQGEPILFAAALGTQTLGDPVARRAVVDAVIAHNHALMHWIADREQILDGDPDTGPLHLA